MHRYELALGGSAVATSGGEATHAVYPDYNEVDAQAPIDCMHLARRAIEQGLFRVDETMLERNDTRGQGVMPLPTRPLERVYNDVSARYLLYQGKDLPSDVKHALYKNNRRVNSLLLSTRELGLYFCNRFQDPDLFRASSSIESALKGYFDTDLPSNNRTDVPPFSTPADGVDRSSFRRNIFHPSERVAQLRHVYRHPAIVLAVAMYQGTVVDYLTDIGMSFEMLSAEPDSGLAPRDIKEYWEFVSLWGEVNANPVTALPMAITLYVERARRAHPHAPYEAVMTPDLFRDAFAFLKEGVISMPLLLLSRKRGRPATQSAISEMLRICCGVRRLIF